MGERKVLIRYVPPDFDPSLIPKMKRDKERLIEIRMMLPFSLRCNTCGEYMYQGKKFNSRKEMIVGGDYLGIRTFRFYIKCSVCSSEITFKTDPKNSDYECESGASRNFEIWRDTKDAMEEVQKEREEEDEYDSMKALENRTAENKVEMDVLDALDEIKAMSQRHEKVDTAKILESINKSKNAQNNASDLTAEDEELLKSVRFRMNNAKNNGNVNSLHSSSLNGSTGSSNIYDNVKDQMSKINNEKKSNEKLQTSVIIKKKRKIDNNDEKNVKVSKVEDNRKNENNQAPVALGGLLQSYGDSDSD